MIPCKKCLVFSTCKNRKEISCDQLYKWVIERKDVKRAHRIVRSIFEGGVKVSCSEKMKRKVDDDNLEKLQQKILNYNIKAMKDEMRETKSK